jgi:hypothetical protein
MGVANGLCLYLLWGMYHDIIHARMDERVDNAKLVKELADDINNIRKSTLVS